MHFWIDIDKRNYIPFYKAIIKELKKRSHEVSVTAIKNKAVTASLKKNGLNVDYIGFEIPLFGKFIDNSNSFRTYQLSEYIEKRKIDVGFSITSKNLLTLCGIFTLPAIIYIEEKEPVIDQLYFYEKCFFVIPNTIHIQYLNERGIELEKIKQVNAPLNKLDSDPNAKHIKELVDSLEFLGNHLPGGGTIV